MNARSFIAALSICASGLLIAALVVGAGPLSPPPGPVAPTKKPLGELEPRVVVNAENTPGDATSLFIINQPGSYYLASNIIGESGKHGVVIAADDVALDLNGFTLQGAAGSLHGVSDANIPRNNITLRNGIVRDWGGDGASLASSLHGRFIDATFASNGGAGVRSGHVSIYDRCIAANNGDSGIVAGQNSALTHCLAEANGGTGGIDVDDRSTIVGCAARNNATDGFFVRTGCLITQCAAGSNGQDGIELSTGSAAIGNELYDNGLIDTVNGSGIHASHADARIEGNNLSGNARGIVVSLGGCFIVKNSVAGSSPAYALSGVNTVGEIITAPGAIARDISPWANFED